MILFSKNCLGDFLGDILQRLGEILAKSSGHTDSIQ